ncbi:MAG: flagellar hook-associated protein 3 [bacterium]|nr:flagellar hook-associated protein 3 [bacterium]
MAFRISDDTTFRNSVRNSRFARFELYKLQAQLSSGKRINSVSDDPSDASRILALRRSSAQVEQYMRNVDAATARLEPIEQVLSTVTDLLSHVRELTVSADTETPQFDLIKSEVEERFDELLGLANTHFGNGYLFGGFDSASAPFTQTGAFVEGTVDLVNPAITFGGDSGVVKIQIGEGSTIDANVSGASVFMGDFDGDGSTDAGAVNLFALIRDVRNRLEDPTVAGDPVFGGTNPGPSETLDDLDNAIDQILAIRGGVGGRLNRLITTSNQFEGLKITRAAERSTLEDLDIIAAASELSVRENTYQASLAVTARIIQPSLLDFLG